MNTFRSLFNSKRRPMVIGMVHCAPLPGYDDHPGMVAVERAFLDDLGALIAGEIDAVMIENNYDIPHREKALGTTVAPLTELCVKARNRTDIPLGLSVLWNDYETALSIAKKTDLQFVRIPVFVDRVKTEYGIFEPKADACIAFREKIGAENVLLLADIQVKHADHLTKRPLAEAAKEAIRKGADGLIVTGRWTGDPPTIEDVHEVVKIAGGTPVFLGSGITPENFFSYDVDAVIVGTFFKEDMARGGAHEQNIFPWQARINQARVAAFMKMVR